MVATAFFGPFVGTALKGSTALKGLAITATAWQGSSAGDSHEASQDIREHGGHEPHEPHEVHEDHAEHEPHEAHGDHAEHEDHEHGEHDEHDEEHVEHEEQHEEHDEEAGEHDEHGEEHDDHEAYEDHNEHGGEEHEELEAGGEETAAEEVETQVSHGLVRPGRDDMKDKDTADEAATDTDGKGVTAQVVGRVLKVTAAASVVLSAASRLIESRCKDLGLAPWGALAAACITPCPPPAEKNGTAERGEGGNRGSVRHRRACGGLINPARLFDL
mmetsp:Transcript_36173/g.99698  ORF Transcript_36173/g.99698 Transcript_36173/m.99698 type:complete len:273 (-) Transcript_36173:55-873(-)